MSEFAPHPQPEGNENINHEPTPLDCLVGMLEDYACAYSEDYEREIDDGVVAERGEVDFGGELESSVRFEVLRRRARLGGQPDVPGEDIVDTEYIVRTRLKQHSIPYATLPPVIYAYINTFEDFNTSDYDEGTLVELEYEQTAVATSLGDFTCVNSLSIYIDGEGVALPDDPAKLEEFDEAEEYERYSADNEKQLQWAELLGEDVFVELMSELTDAESDYYTDHPMSRFYSYMGMVQGLGPEERMEYTENIVKMLFS